jgi:exodeoxyribonuclease VII small subunit
MEEKITFETALARLQTIVSGLESGNVPLDDSLSMFEEGVKLVKFCNEKLDHAEQKVKILLKDGEDYREQDFAKTE